MKVIRLAVGALVVFGLFCSVSLAQGQCAVEASRNIYRCTAPNCRSEVSVPNLVPPDYGEDAWVWAEELVGCCTYNIETWYNTFNECEIIAPLRRVAWVSMRPVLVRTACGYALLRPVKEENLRTIAAD